MQCKAPRATSVCMCACAHISILRNGASTVEGAQPSLCHQWVRCLSCAASQWSPSAKVTQQTALQPWYWGGWLCPCSCHIIRPPFSSIDASLVGTLVKEIQGFSTSRLIWSPFFHFSSTRTCSGMARVSVHVLCLGSERLHLFEVTC